MSGSLNKVILIGHLGKDPEIRTLGSGDRVANFRIATSESWRDKASGERKEKTEWHSIVVFNDNIVGVVDRFVKKGSLVCIEGSLQTRKWQDKEGQDRYSTEVVIQRFGGQLTMLGGKKEGDDDRGGSDRGSYGGGGGGDYGSSSGRGSYGGGPKLDQGVKERESFTRDLDDEIPF